MWSSSRLARNALLALVFLAPGALLSGCAGLTPLYGESGIEAERIDLAYAAPETRLEQIIYQTLALRLGDTRAPEAPLVTVSASQASRALTSGSVVTPSEQREMVVNAEVKVTDSNGRIVFSARRSASALYSAGPQSLANQSAEIEAAERAAKALAETIRLTLLAALQAPTQGQ